jgi:16S rRNA (guanine527-N7)-methyltransferase
MFQVKQLQQGAQRLGIVLTKEHLETFATYHQLLLDWNQRMNLISRADESRIITHHFLDSLTPVPHLDWPEGIQLLDLGSGAGFPGVPIKIVRPEVSLTVLDSRRKRILFLKKLVPLLSLQSASIICERAEKLHGHEQYMNRFSLVTARSVAPLSKLVPLVLPFLRTGGKLIVYKGPDESSDQSNLNIPVTITEIPVQFPKPRTLMMVEKL